LGTFDRRQPVEDGSTVGFVHNHAHEAVADIEGGQNGRAEQAKYKDGR
jgi:hypothetical protein